MATRRQYQQRQLRKAFGRAIALLTLLLLSRTLAGGNTPAFTFSPLYQPNTLAPASEPLEVDPDPRATVLAERLRQHLVSLQTAAPYTPSPPLTPEQSHALSALETRCPGEVSVVLRPLAGTPRQIKGAVLQSAQAGSDPPLTTARTFLRTNCDLLRLDDPNAELVLTRRHTDKLGRTHLRFRQQYQGVPVWPADILVHLNPAGHVDVMNGAFVPTPKDLSTVPVLDEATAVEYARTGLTDGAEAEVTASELIIYALGNTPPRLAWKLELALGVTAQWLVVIDAVNGAELTAYNQIMHDHVGQHFRGSGVDLFGELRDLNVWKQDSFFWMIDTNKPMFDPSLGIDSERGVIRIRDAENQPETSDPQEIELPFPIRVARLEPPHFGWLPDAVSAAYNLSEVYDYYLERHGWDSFDGQGASITAIVRLGQDFANAFWHPGLNLLAFGDAKPYAGALDVVGHELTHGVISHSANLVYQDQPGALNEAFADIFGEMIEAWWTKGEPDWLVGTALITELDPPARNMKNPAALTFDQGGTRPYPTKMSEYVYTPADNGGVHINSSIINRAFYLLAEGLDDDDEISLKAAEKIFYHALTMYLFQYSQFIDARLACIQAAKDLSEKYPEMYPDDAAQKVAEAFDAVEIFDAAPTPPPQRVPAFPGPDASLFVYQDVGGNPRLGRREEAQGDGVQGVQLADAVLATARTPVSRNDGFVVARPSVSRDGALAVFVNADNDICAISTNGEGEECLGFPDDEEQPIHIYSVAISPDRRWLGFVLLDELNRNPENIIWVISLETEEAPRSYELRAPSYGGPPLDTIRYARTMDFTLDGQWIVYDALNAASLDHNTRIERWSLYALNLNTGENLDLVPPTPGFRIAFPALSQTSDNFLTFDVFDEYQNQSAVYIANLHTGELSPIATVEDGFGVPGFTGDDSALVYSQRDPRVSTGFSLVRQPLQADHTGRITPRGEPSIWLANAHFGVIYRRAGRYAGLNGVLENPLSDSFQSGVGLFSGWVCLTGPRGEPPPPATPEVAARYFYDALEHKESSVDDAGNWWARTGSTNGTHITGQTTVQEIVDQVQRFTISYVDDDGHDRTEFYETLLGGSGIFTIDIGDVRLSWPITHPPKSTLPPPPRSPAGTVIPPRITIDVEPGATVRNQDGSPWVPVQLTQTMDELGRDMYVVNVLQPYIPGRLEVSRVEIEINGSPPLPAAYRTERRDTTGVCGDSDNGFGLLFNWNLLRDGPNTVRALADGVEFDQATFTVTTLGKEFVRGAEGECTVSNFPMKDETVTLHWQESMQNFVIADYPLPPRATPVRTANAAVAQADGLSGLLENPFSGSFQSGIGLFSGWVCDASQVEIEIDGDLTFMAGYGTNRIDTVGACGDSNNGFGLLFNWNLLGGGGTRGGTRGGTQHTVRALADGVEFDRATFTVTTLGTEFVRGAEGECVVPNFPAPGDTVTLMWQESMQNFVITDYEQPQ